jgi:hypothetical protein
MLIKFFSFILLIIGIICVTITFVKYYYDFPNVVYKYKYINRSCQDIDNIPVSILYK